MGAIAQQGVGYFYGHLDRWAALYDNRSLGKPVRLRDPKADAVDESGEVVREGRVDVIARLQETRLALFYGAHFGRAIASRDDVPTAKSMPSSPRGSRALPRPAG